MSIEAPLPPEEHIVTITEVDGFYEVTCACGFSRNVQATPASVNKNPAHWAENVKLRHEYISGKSVPK